MPEMSKSHTVPCGPTNATHFLESLCMASVSKSSSIPWHLPFAVLGEPDALFDLSTVSFLEHVLQAR